MEHKPTNNADDVTHQLDELTKQVNANELSGLYRFKKNVSLSPASRLRLEPVELITGTVLKSKHGEMIGGANQSGITLICNTPAQSLTNVGVWVPVSNSMTPLLVTLAASSNNQTIKLSSGVNAGYIILNNTAGASVNLTGLVATEAGHELVLLNMSAQNVVVVNSSASSLAANRVYTTSAADVTLAQHASIRLRYRASVGTYITETRTGWQQTN